eukprot:GHUV01026974.1.p1 GENE.GHUV01026974.1~~GHUV01026974.1.p1  ORF type:complete len:137 (-),score=18.68 GHUV01026974.1:428-838(-)
MALLLIRLLGLRKKLVYYEYKPRGTDVVRLKLDFRGEAVKASVWHEQWQVDDDDGEYGWEPRHVGSSQLGLDSVVMGLHICCPAKQRDGLLVGCSCRVHVVHMLISGFASMNGLQVLGIFVAMRALKTSMHSDFCL